MPDPRVASCTVPKVVARLEEIARIPLPPDTTDVTDRVDEVQAAARPLVEADEAFRRELIAAADAHTNPQVVFWLSVLLSPDISAAVTDPARFYRQAAVPVTDAQAPLRTALTLHAKTEEYFSFLERRRLRRRPWEVAHAWFFGEPQASGALDTWPVAQGRPLPFWVQVDLQYAEDNVRPSRFAQVGLPSCGYLQLFADPDGVPEGALVAHQVVYVPDVHGIADEPLPRPRGVERRRVHLVVPDVAETLPHEDEVAGADAWTPGERFDYQVIQRQLDRDPYRRNPQVRYAGDNRSPVLSDFRPVVPMARLGGHPVAPRTVLEPALSALACPVEEVYPLFDLPLQAVDDGTEDPNQPRFAVLMRRSDLRASDFGKTVSVRYRA